jgi:predicted DNA-binding protein (MmcQ/YjbR family)
MTSDQVLALALSLPGTQLYPHFDKQSVRVGSKIFLTLGETDFVTLKLSVLLQEAVIANHPESVYAVPNAWGTKGWSRVYLRGMSERDLSDILDLAWRQVAPKALIKKGI